MNIKQQLNPAPAILEDGFPLSVRFEEGTPHTELISWYKSHTDYIDQQILKKGRHPV